MALLGVAAATVADRPGAHELLNRMLEEQKELWTDDYGLVWDQYDEAFNEPVPVHTLGTLIHTIEAYMAAAEATTEPEWLDRAEKMTAFAYKIRLQRTAGAFPSSSTISGRPTPRRASSSTTDAATTRAT